MMVEAGADHPGVPALSFQLSAMGRGQPKNHHAVFRQFGFIFIVCTAFAI